MAHTRHIVLATYGEPQAPRFADQLAYSWRILCGLTRKVDAIPRALLPVIAMARAHSRRKGWRDVGYRSPLEPITDQQAHGLRHLLTNAAVDVAWQVRVAYEYRRPLVSETLKELPAAEPAWIVPVYAADSEFTHQLARDAAVLRSGPTFVLNPLAPHVLGSISADHVRALTTAPEWHGPDTALVLAAHGTVLNPPTPIETGQRATEALCHDIVSRLNDRFGVIVNGWLNHTRGGRWTEPPISEALATVARQGFRRVVYYPYGFLADNAESQLEGRLALAQTSLATLHLPCLNDNPALLDALCRQVLRCAGWSFTSAHGAAEGRSTWCGGPVSGESLDGHCGLCVVKPVSAATRLPMGAVAPGDIKATG